jgi:imidazolonepropionase-like amidohydrolase
VTTTRLGLTAIMLLVSMPAALAAQLAVRADVVYTMAAGAEPIRNGVVLVGANGKIERVGTAASIVIPPNYRVLTAKAVTPGFIDAHSVVGLTGPAHNPEDQDEFDRSGPIQPELRAIDSYNARDVLVEYVRRWGVTTLHTGHSPSAPMSGQIMVVKTHGRSVEADVVRPFSAVAMRLGPQAFADGQRRTDVSWADTTRAALNEARAYVQARQRDSLHVRNLRLEAIVALLDGSALALVSAQSRDDIRAALALKKEFGLEVVLEGAAEARYHLDEIKTSGTPVILTSPSVSFTSDGASHETLKQLVDAGIPVALLSGYAAAGIPKTRTMLFEAGLAAGLGLTTVQALATITRDAARILRIHDRVGTLEAGKDGDLVLFDAIDPVETLSRVCATVIDGRVYTASCR